MSKNTKQVEKKIAKKKVVTPSVATVPAAVQTVTTETVAPATPAETVKKPAKAKTGVKKEKVEKKTEQTGEKVKRPRQSKKVVLQLTGLAIEKKVKLFTEAMAKLYSDKFNPQATEDAGLVKIVNKNNKEISVIVRVVAANLRTQKTVDKEGLVVNLNCGKSYKFVSEYLGKLSVSRVDKYIRQIADEN
jgi:hypothetical protein